jgi:phospholipase C
MIRLSGSGAPFAGAVFLILGLSGCGESSLTPPPPPSYSLAATALSPATVTAGSAATSTITVTPANGGTGSLTLSCGGLTGANAPACSFSPNPITVSGNAALSTLTISTTIDTPGGSYAISVTGKEGSGGAPTNGPQSLALTTAAVIQHVVVIFQENRTPDNLFQGLCIPPYGSAGACGTGQDQYDIAQQGTNSAGKTITLAPIDLGTAGTNPQNYDLSHSHTAFVQMFDNGKMDGADLISCSPAAECPPNAHPNPQFMYVNPADVAPYLAMAQQYTFGDRMFQTNQGPSFPAHQFIFSGTSAPSAPGAEYSTYFAAENLVGGSIAGCIATAGTTVTLIGPTGIEVSPGLYPCYDHPAMSDLLDANGVTWRYYTPSAGSIWTAPDALENLCQAETVNGALACTGPDWTSDVIIPGSRVLKDIASRELQQVSWVIPDGAYSDHADISNGSGPSWVASIVNAIGNSSYWANTAILITWDDWGGWYDHVAPKVINDGVSWGSGYVYGFRVPLVVVSPYAKAKYISHTTHDFGSILKFIESTYGLPSLGYSDAYADDLSDCFNLTQTPIVFQTIDAPLEAAHFTDSKEAAIDPDDDDDDE